VVTAGIDGTDALLVLGHDVGSKAGSPRRLCCAHTPARSKWWTTCRRRCAITAWPNAVSRPSSVTTPDWTACWPPCCVSGCADLTTANEHRRRISATYTKAFRDLPIVLPPNELCHVSAVHHYVVQVDDRTELLRTLTGRGVDARAHYPVSALRQPALRDKIIVPTPLRRTEAQADHIVSPPCSPR
jgi:hypothetical protein